MRQRAISAVVLVPVLLIVLAIGGPVLSAAVALVTVLAATEVFRLLKGAGYAPFAALGCVLALAIVLEAAFPEALDGSGVLLAAIGIVLIGVAGFTKVEPRDGLQAWMATVFGAFYVSLLSFIIRLGNAAPDVPAGAPFSALGPERGWILLLILAVWSFDTGAYLTGRSIGRTHFITHISPAKTVEGVVGGVVASARIRSTPSRSARWSRSRRRPATSPNRSSSGRPVRRTRGRSSPATAGSSTGSTRSCSPHRS